MVREWQSEEYDEFVDWLERWYEDLASVPIVGSGMHRGQEPFLAAHGPLRVDVERLDASHRDPPRPNAPGDTALKVGNADYVLRARTFRGAWFEDQVEPSWYWRLGIDLFGRPPLMLGLHREDPAYDEVDTPA